MFLNFLIAFIVISEATHCPCASDDKENTGKTIFCPVLNAFCSCYNSIKFNYHLQCNWIFTFPFPNSSFCSLQIPTGNNYPTQVLYHQAHAPFNKIWFKLPLSYSSQSSSALPVLSALCWLPSACGSWRMISEKNYVILSCKFLIFYILHQIKKDQKCI